MTQEELRQLSKAELIEMVLRQQAQIEQLQAILTEREGQLAEAEAQRDYLTGFEESSSGREEMAEHVVIDHQDKKQAVRDALRCFHDTDYLARSTLADLMVGTHGNPPDGRAVQQTLRRAIEAAKPAARRSNVPRRQRRYDILRLTYLEKKGAQGVAEELSISKRQYYRDLKAAIRWMTDRVLGG